MLRSGPYTNCRFTLSCMTEGYLSRNDFLTRCVTKSRASKLMGYMCLSADTISSYKSNSTCKNNNKSHVLSNSQHASAFFIFKYYLQMLFTSFWGVFFCCHCFSFFLFFFFSSFLLFAAFFSSLFFSLSFLFLNLKTSYILQL